jgi:hypothetical protein
MSGVGNAPHSRGLEVDCQSKLACLLDREITGLGVGEDFSRHHKRVYAEAAIV